MNNFVLFILLSFFIEGVFGESVSVTNGDSVTLHTGLTEKQKDDVLVWGFGAGLVRIARVNKDGDPTTYDDVLGGRFRGRLKLDGQTGDLTITNITTEDAGPYKISTNPSRTFNVIVVPDVDGVKSVSLIVGDSVTLNSGTNIHRDDVIEWRFGDLNSLIAENNRKTGNFSTSDGPDGRFGERLQLDYWTGSLTIRNTRTKHSGLYEAGIRKSNSLHTLHKSYSVTASDEMKTAVSVKEGDSVTLHTNLTEKQRDDLMQWMFEDTVLAEINKAHKRFLTYDGPDERFRDRLKLDDQTGSLTITNTRNTHSGLYNLKTSSSRFSINKRFTVTVTVSDPPLSSGAVAGIVIGVLVLVGVVAGAAAAVIYHKRIISEVKEWVYKWGMKSVMEGDPITLTPDETDVHDDDKLQWIFRGSCIAKRESAADGFTVNYGPDGRFGDRLELDLDTGSLTITNTRNTDSGVYELLIIRPEDSSIKRFSVSVFARTEIETKSVVSEGGSVTLETGVADIQKNEQIQWKLGYTLLAKVKRGTKKISPSADKMFKDRLKLDHKTGSLTINKIRPTDAGVYMLYKIEGGEFTSNLFRVKVGNKPEESVRINNPEENVPLTTVDG